MRGRLDHSLRSEHTISSCIEARTRYYRPFLSPMPQNCSEVVTAIVNDASNFFFWAFPPLRGKKIPLELDPAENTQISRT